jgi:hypothetical protein
LNEFICTYVAGTLRCAKPATYRCTDKVSGQRVLLCAEHARVVMKYGDYEVTPIE